MASPRWQPQERALRDDIDRKWARGPYRKREDYQVTLCAACGQSFLPREWPLHAASHPKGTFCMVSPPNALCSPLVPCRRLAGHAAHEHAGALKLVVWVR